VGNQEDWCHLPNYTASYPIPDYSSPCNDRCDNLVVSDTPKCQLDTAYLQSPNANKAARLGQGILSVRNVARLRGTRARVISFMPSTGPSWADFTRVAVRLSATAPTTHLAVGIFGSVPTCSQHRVKTAQNTGNGSVRPLRHWMAHRAGLQRRTQRLTDCWRSRKLKVKVSP